MRYHVLSCAFYSRYLFFSFLKLEIQLLLSVKDLKHSLLVIVPLKADALTLNFKSSALSRD